MAQLGPLSSGRGEAATRGSARTSQTPPARASSLMLFDLAAIGLAMAAAWSLRTAAPLQPFWVSLGFPAAPFLVPYGNIIIATLAFQAIMIPFVMYAIGRYAPMPHEYGMTTAARVGMAALLAQYPLLGVFFLLKIGVPRGMMILDFTLLAILVAGWRVAWGRRERARMEEGHHVRSTLIIGGDATAQRIAHEILVDNFHGRRIVGFLADRPLEVDGGLTPLLERPDVWASGKSGQEIPVNVSEDGTPRRLALRTAVTANVVQRPRHMLVTVGGLSPADITQAIDGLCAEEVFISAEVGHETAEAVVRACRERAIDVHLVPTYYPGLGTNPSPWTLGAQPVISLYSTPLSRPSYALKRGLDIAGSAFGLLILSPIILAAAIAIKIESPDGPVFFKQARVGYKGRHFAMVKLRTMFPDAERRRDELLAKNQRKGPWFKLDHDPRILRVGHFLRKYSIDEIPQFINVFKGDMGLVGPRPLPVKEAAEFVDYDMRYYRRLDVKPGMTGPWQISSREDPSFDSLMALDMDYITNWSIWVDVKLLVKTPFAVLFKSRGK